MCVIVLGWCETAWDGLMCWPSAQPDTLQVQGCPEYAHMSHVDEEATRYCDVNGSWFYNPEYNTTWTNYSKCFTDDEEEFVIDSQVPDLIRVNKTYPLPLPSPLKWYMSCRAGNIFCKRILPLGNFQWCFGGIMSQNICIFLMDFGVSLRSFSENSTS